MNSYSFSISTSYFFPILLIILALLFTIYSYRRTIPEIGGTLKRILILLRWLAITAIIILLFEPALESKTVEKVSSKVAVLIDNSESVSFQNEKINNRENFFAAYQNSDINNLSNSIIYRFGNETNLTDKDSIEKFDFADKSTNLKEAINRIGKDLTRENIKSLVVFSDGNFNNGGNPIYSSKQLGIPIYSVVSADTSKFRDILLSDLSMNKLAYVNSPVQINYKLENEGLLLDSIPVYLKEDQIIKDTSYIKLSENRKLYSQSFYYYPENSGVKLISISTPFNEIEFSSKNNSQSGYIKVLDSKKKISLFAGAPSYDVSILSKFINQDRSVDFKKFIQKKGAEYYLEPTPEAIQNTQLFVFSDFPNSSTSNAVLSQIRKELKKGKPFFFQFSKNLDYNKLKVLSDIMPFEVISSSNKEFTALPFVNERNLSNGLVRISGSDSDLSYWNNLSPLFKTETFLKLKTGAKSIVDINVNNTILNEPLIIQSEVGESKSIILTGYGLNSWRISSFSKDILLGKSTPDVTFKFLENSFKWLVVKNEGRKFQIKTNKEKYLEGEPVVVEAQVYDESYEAFDDAEVKVQVKNESQERDIILSNIGNGKYVSTIEGLTKGEFSVSGLAKYKDKTIGTDESKFEIGDLLIEYSKLSPNTGFLKNLSESNGGKVYFQDNVRELVEDINNKGLLKEEETLVTNVNNFWEEPYLLILAVLLFSSEWLIRKRLGMM